MTYRMRAVYRGGAFVPESRCPLPDNAEVNLVVQGPLRTPPAVADPEERRRLLRRITSAHEAESHTRQCPAVHPGRVA